jgi:hypothetical protein
MTENAGSGVGGPGTPVEGLHHHVYPLAERLRF